MILSASRRTDLPALYGEWVTERLRAGEVLVQNPYRAGQAACLKFSPETVDCIVFWTKNPIPFEKYLPQVEKLGYKNYYFEYTVTAFGPEWEPGLPPLEERLAAFQRFSGKLGSERVDWRFDPIVIDDAHPPKWYADRFEALCRRLAGCTRRCIISFVDHYAHLGRAFPDTALEDMKITAALLAPIAAGYGLPLYTCAEEADLSAYGIGHAACIDREKIEQLIGCSLAVKKDPGQRSACGCAASVDIGAYNTCVNGCAYCYASKSKRAALRNFQSHDPESPLLAGKPNPGLTVTEKQPASWKSGQTVLF